MADTPQSLTLKENRDASEVYELASRRAFFLLVTLVLLLGLANAYGQSPTGWQQRIGSLENVRWAVLESNGKVSFLTKS